MQPSIVSHSKPFLQQHSHVPFQFGPPYIISPQHPELRSPFRFLAGNIFTFFFKPIKLIVFFHCCAAPSDHKTATKTATKAEPVFPLGAGLFLSSGFINRFTKSNTLLLLFLHELHFITAPVSPYLEKGFLIFGQQQLTIYQNPPQV